MVGVLPICYCFHGGVSYFPPPYLLSSDAIAPTHHLLPRDRYGYAHFDSLSIKEAGIGYKLGFTAAGLTSAFSGDTYVESSMFTVGVGPADRLELANDILAGAIVSGSPFEEQVVGPYTAAETAGGMKLTCGNKRRI